MYHADECMYRYVLPGYRIFQTGETLRPRLDDLHHVTSELHRCAFYHVEIDYPQYLADLLLNPLTCLENDASALSEQSDMY